ncbi:MAG: ATP phosphoribosyltransferase regulatory subunit [Pseudomonadota bacterium]|nr:MAG: ATP phosphoribosyltransferase regulatory subunit [Pseudomonadota bacterium]
MTSTDRWLLPEGIEEILPGQARRIERLSRELLDLFERWGYEFVIPPFIEYLESLLIGTGNDLNLQTFKLTDQLTGRMMGVRADMTPQVARIDAHHLKRETPTRLCYMGTVLHTRPDGFAGSRSPLQVGVELYGHAGVESDLEVLTLMAETLRVTGIADPYFDLGHVGIFRGLTRQAQLDAEQEAELFDALQRKAKPEIDALLNNWSLPANVSGMLAALADLNGGEKTLGAARAALSGASDDVLAALADLERLAELAGRRLGGASLHFDLAELRGYNYHTGAVFAAFVPSRGQAVAQGGRYDDIGHAFGRARPATGFSTDLKTLIALGTRDAEQVSRVFAPGVEDAGLDAVVAELRNQGECVVCALPGQRGDAQQMGCDRQLVQRGSTWEIESL